LEISQRQKDRGFFRANFVSYDNNGIGEEEKESEEGIINAYYKN
jgi:hypothetical protein